MKIAFVFASLSVAAASLLATGCSSSTTSDADSADADAKTVSASDCKTACASKANQCGDDPSQCSDFCTSSLPASVIACITGLSCDGLESGGVQRCESDAKTMSGDDAGMNGDDAGDNSDVCGCSAKANGASAFVACNSSMCVGGESFYCGYQSSNVGDLEDKGACTTQSGTDSGPSADGCDTHSGATPGSTCDDSTPCEEFVCYCADGEGRASGSIAECESGKCLGGDDACKATCAELGGVSSTTGCNN